MLPPTEVDTQNNRFTPRLVYKSRDTQIEADGLAAVVLAAIPCGAFLITIFKIVF